MIFNGRRSFTIQAGMRIIFLMASMFPPAVSVESQELSLWLGGMEMRLGMPQSAVMDQLSGKYDVWRMMIESFWLILERTSDAHRTVQ